MLGGVSPSVQNIQQTTPVQPAAPAAPGSVNGRRPIAMQVRHATKYYKTSTGAVHALEDINLDIPEGEFTCIVGPSGCGKTTLLWGLSGLHELTSGEVILNGTPVKGPRPEIDTRPRCDISREFL